jgi:predicted GNAT family N-acyltransferase
MGATTTVFRALVFNAVVRQTRCYQEAKIVNGSPTITVELSDHFTPAMEMLRREFEDKEWPDNSSEDRFDAFSSHIVLSVNSKLAGMVRLTNRPPSVLAAWAIGSHHLPEGDDIVEATRAVVAKSWRGMGFYKILMTEATAWCHATGVPSTVAAIEVDFPLQRLLSRIGFRDVGEPTLFVSCPRSHVKCQVIVQQPAQAIEAAMAIRQACIERLDAKGFCVRSSVVNGPIASSQRTAPRGRDERP